MSDLIEKLSNLRSQFNCFNENEREVYHTLSEAIKVISERPEPCEDTVSRQTAIDALLKEVRLVDGYYVENDEVIDKDDAIEAIRLLPSAQPEPCDCEKCKKLFYEDL